MDNEKEANITAEEDGLSLKDIFYIIKKHLIAILAFLVIFTALGFTYSKITPKKYEASATMLVSVDNNDITVTQAYQFSSYISQTFVAFIKEDVVLDEVVAQSADLLEAETAAGKLKELKSNLSISLTSSTLIINVKYTSSSPEKARDICNLIVEKADEIANSTVTENGEEVARFRLLKDNLKTLTPAKNGVKVSSTLKNMVVFFVIGVVVAAIYVILREVLNTKFKSSEEVERTLNIPILAGIPEYEIPVEEEVKSNE